MKTTKLLLRLVVLSIIFIFSSCSDDGILMNDLNSEISEKGGKPTDGFSIMIAPVNHNKLNHSKTIQIVHTILGNIYQSENEVTIANQDFGNDASLIVGYHSRTEQAKTKQSSTIQRKAKRNKPMLS